MRRIKNPDDQPIFVLQDSAEVFMVDHLARYYTTDEHLKAKTVLLLDEVVDYTRLPEMEQFVGPEADLILNALRQLINNRPETDWRVAQAKQMLGQYADPAQRDLDLMLPAERAEIQRLDAALHHFEVTGRLN
ncbi:MAG TPA: hypothetical protein VLG37_04545 [Candidatus Saccharimonadales bacterium]|nr:hypothetical protein [Candidatus Saccharimonadales bacterium]